MMVTLEVGTYLDIAFDDWGIENFEKEIICLCKDEDEMDKMESHLIAENVRRGIKLYNICGVFKTSGFGANWTEDHKSNHSSLMKRYWDDPEWVAKRQKGWTKSRSAAGKTLTRTRDEKAFDHPINTRMINPPKETHP